MLELNLFIISMMFSEVRIVCKENELVSARVKTIKDLYFISGLKKEKGMDTKVGGTQNINSLF